MRALILVDIQNDFMPDGSLPVPGGYEVVPLASRLAENFELVVATQDWHPPNHESFAKNHESAKIGEVIDLHGLEQVLWPVHCVQDTPGAQLVDGLNREPIDKIVQKGTDSSIDSYSGFFDNGHRKATGLHDYLEERDVDTVVICGVATDYCVKYTVLDAVRLGYETIVVRDACRGVEITAGDIEDAWKEMREAGAELVFSDAVLEQE